MYEEHDILTDLKIVVLMVVYANYLVVPREQILIDSHNTTDFRISQYAVLFIHRVCN